MLTMRSLPSSPCFCCCCCCCSEQPGTRLEADTPPAVADPHQQGSPAPSGGPGAGPWQHPALKGSRDSLSNNSAGAAAAAAADTGGPVKPAHTWELHVPWGKVAVLVALLVGEVDRGGCCHGVPAPLCLPTRPTINCWSAWPATGCFSPVASPFRSHSHSHGLLPLFATAPALFCVPLPLPQCGTHAHPPPTAHHTHHPPPQPLPTPSRPRTLAGVVASDVLKLQVACPSLAYWLCATVMVPITVATLFAVRLVLGRGGVGGKGGGRTRRVQLGR